MVMEVGLLVVMVDFQLLDSFPSFIDVMGSLVVMVDSDFMVDLESHCWVSVLNGKVHFRMLE